LTGQPQLEEELVSEIAKLQSSLSKEQEKCALLHHQVEHLLSRHSEEISARDDIVSQLNTELDAKANVIALVTQQLCQVRAKLKQEVEARSKKSISCACPHCLIHRKSAPSTDRKLSTLREAELSSGAENTRGNLHIPSPPSVIAPHPPPPMPGRNRTIKRRASTPIRRQPSPPQTSLTNLSLDSSTERSQRFLRPKNPLSDFQQFVGLKDGISNPVRRETCPILPPIPTFDEDSSTGDVLKQSHSVPVDASAHPRLILAKPKGLSSAPSALRVLHYGTSERGRGGGNHSGEAKEGSEGEDSAFEGTLLLVKENDRGNMGPPPQCAAPWTD
jgi:hypothetical protein